MPVRNDVLVHGMTAVPIPYQIEAHIRVVRVEYWNKPPHPIVEPIVRVFPHASPVMLIKKLTIYADKDAPGWLIAEREWTDGSKTVERQSLAEFAKLRLPSPPGD
jgi:hypothetical protein